VRIFLLRGYIALFFLRQISFVAIVSSVNKFFVIKLQYELESIMRSYTFIIAVLILCFLPAGESAWSRDKSLNVHTFFSSEDVSAVKRGIPVTRAMVKAKETVVSGSSKRELIIPDSPFISGDFKKYELIMEEKAYFPLKKGMSRKDVYNSFFSYSHLSKTKYYSRTEDTVQQLVLSATGLKNRGKTAMADPRYDAVNKQVKHYFMFSDNRFGDQFYEQIVLAENNGFISSCQSTAKMTKYGLTVNNAGESRMITIVIFDGNKGLYYYSLQGMRVRRTTFLNMGIVKPASFGNRIRANTIHFARLLNIDWSDKYAAFH
jgi:hypothetical protein